ncbi:MAG: hypothetical protein ACRDFC_07135 [Ignavibacteria bacterium]
MKRKIILAMSTVMLLAGGLTYHLTAKQQDISYKGTPQSITDNDCPLKGTPNCPVVPGCCGK